RRSSHLHAIGAVAVLTPERRVDHVLRTALVKPAINNAANPHAISRTTQLTAVSQAAVTLAECMVTSQPARPKLVPTGRLRSSPTLSCWITVHDRPGVVVLLVCASAPCEPSNHASTQDTATTPPRNSSAFQGW